MNSRIWVGCMLLGFMLSAGQSSAAQVTPLNELGTNAKQTYLKGDYREAERQFREALAEATVRGAGGAKRASILAGLGRTLVTQGRFAEAEDFLSRVLEIDRQEKIDPVVRTLALSHLAVVYTETYRYDRAEALLKEVLDLSKKQFGPKSVFVAGELKNLGIVYARTGRFKEAENTLKKSLALSENKAEVPRQDFASILTSLAVVYTLRKQFDKAEQLFIRAVDVVERAVGPDHSSIADALCNLGGLYALQGDFDRAETAYRKGLRILLKIFGPDNLDVAHASAGLAGVLTSQKKYAESRSLFLEALPIEERVLGTMSPEYASTLEHYAVLLRKMDDAPQAETVETRAQNIRYALKYTVSAERLKK